MKKTSSAILCFFSLCLLVLNHLPTFASTWEAHNSVAGFFPVEGAGREVYSLNPGWLLLRGDAEGAARKDFDDHAWTRVGLPNGIELLPVEASGGKNYQGPVWYRKHVQLPQETRHKKLFLYFEAIMGRSEVWVNGQKLTEHTGGYLPVILDVSDKLLPGVDNVIAVRADNSDDGSYPPGKPQYQLDFSYFGGIYRDCWLIAHNRTYITDPNYVQETGGGGLFISYDRVSTELADVRMDLQVKSEEQKRFRGRAILKLVNPQGQTVATKRMSLNIQPGSSVTLTARETLKKPDLWSPESPQLYKVYVSIEDNGGRQVDGYYQRFGVRSVEFRAQDGLWLNGKPYETKLIGGNRHQDFAVVGNAVTNSLHRRDAYKLRSAGLKVIRNAHYPQDPSFMDACDELGLFVICPTPGWQYWNEKPSFAEHVYDDIRQIVRRDRNRPSVFLYEPILNETNYPDSFAHNVIHAVKSEYPYKYCYCACDHRQRGKNLFDVWYAHPKNGNTDDNVTQMDSSKTYFTREWGDDVDDWASHNSPSRAARRWGETAMLIQAQHYAFPSYPYTSLEALAQTPRQHVGGALWHPFDHQRGYHPDPFYGGLLDAFRQPKYSYYLFCSQRNPQEQNPYAESGPMVFIANALTPFSPTDISVYSNCEEVRLTVHKDGEQKVYRRDVNRVGMSSPIITFKDAWNFQDDKEYARNNKQDASYMLVEGLIGGKVVARQQEWPARRPTRLLLTLDSCSVPLRADGTDLVTVICSVVDDRGMVKRLNNERILFSVEGEGQLLGNEQTGGNPVNVEWGTAPILLRTTTTPGKIKVRAQLVRSGNMTVRDAELTIQSTPSEYPLLFNRDAVPTTDARPTLVGHSDLYNGIDGETLLQKIDEVSRQQRAFE